MSTEDTRTEQTPAQRIRVAVAHLLNDLLDEDDLTDAAFLIEEGLGALGLVADPENVEWGARYPDGAVDEDLDQHEAEELVEIHGGVILRRHRTPWQEVQLDDD